MVVTKFFPGMLLAVLVAACATPYEEFYNDYSANWAGGLATSTKAPSIVAIAGDQDEVIENMFTNGYAFIGQSYFNAASQDTSGALTQAKKIGAEYVVVGSQFTHTNQGAVPITSQRYVTTNTTGTASAYGTGGYAVGNYQQTSTTAVPVTTMIPYSIDRYDQSALYFAPLKESCLGLLIVELTDDEKRRVKSNRGVRVTAVRNQSPGYYAEILPEDLLLELNGQPIEGPLNLVRGKEVEFTVMRGRDKIKLPLIGGAGCSG